MRLPQNYDPELLVVAITALDWSPDASAAAVKLIQAMVRERFAESLSTADAVWILGSLLNRRLIHMQSHPDDATQNAPGRKQLRRRTKYVQIPPDELDH